MKWEYKIDHFQVEYLRGDLNEEYNNLDGEGWGHVKVESILKGGFCVGANRLGNQNVWFCCIFRRPKEA